MPLKSIYLFFTVFRVAWKINFKPVFSLFFAVLGIEVGVCMQDG